MIWRIQVIDVLQVSCTNIVSAHDSIYEVIQHLSMAARGRGGGGPNGRRAARCEGRTQRAEEEERGFQDRSWDEW